MDASQITELVKRFSGHQRALGLTDARFAARYEQFLGSHKTWTKLKDGTWPGHVSAERIAAKLKAFAEHLDGARSFDTESFFERLPYVVGMNAQFECLLASPLDIRGLISIAPQGVGKSWWASSIIEQNKREATPAPYFYLRLLHSWRDRSYKIQCAIQEKLGGTKTKNPGDQMEDLIRHAKALGEIVLILDEAHNGGIALFKVLKDLIDETPMRFVYLGFPTEFDIVVGSNKSNIGESRQTLRRCMQPIHDDYRDGIGAEDIEVFLAGCGLKSNAELRKVSAEIQPYITARYNLTTLATAVRQARKEADDNNAPLSLDLVTNALAALCSTASQRRATLAQLRNGGPK